MKSNNPYEIFEIDHLSPSSINTFIQSPAKYVMRYLFDYKTVGGPAMWRGTATDEAIGKYFEYETKPDLTIPECVRYAEDLYDQLYKSFKDKHPDQKVDMDKHIKEAKQVGIYTKLALDFYKDLGQPTAYQKKIELQLDSIPIPIIGYIDLLYPNLVRDIKTTARYPYEVSSAHARQMALYAKAEDCSPVLDYIYVTTRNKEVVTKPVNDVEERIKEIERVGLTIMNLLSLSNDKYEIANYVYPDLDTWLWSKEEKEFAKTIWS